jgi:prepilin-type N-terminal cleavage/methylation domain-containing protein
MKGRRPSTAGFTLVEVLIALVLASTIALLAHRIFATAIEGDDSLRRSRLALDRMQGVHRLLTAIFLSVEVGMEGAGSFEGRPGTMRFSSSLETPGGWFERTPIELSVEQDHLELRMAGQPDVVLTDSVAAVEFDYLLQPGAESRWVREWISPVTAPLAIRVRISRSGRLAGDTTLYLIKGRG